MDYYVYAYLRDDGTPYYIGKGQRNRAWAKGKTEVTKPGKNRIAIVESRLTATGALAIERRLIRWYGRIDQGTGILRNRTNGGDGGAGAQPGNTLSDETKQKISAAHKGKTRSPMSEESKKKLAESMKGKNTGKIRTDEQKAAQSMRQTGRSKPPCSEETKQKLRKANLGKKRGPISEEHRRRLGDIHRGKPKSPEQVAKQRKKVTGRKPSEQERQAFLKAMSIMYTCEHCGKSTNKGNYRRWHGDSCRSKPYLTGEKPIG